jgi:hypothetical protein
VANNAHSPHAIAVGDSRPRVASMTGRIGDFVPIRVPHLGRQRSDGMANERT